MTDALTHGVFLPEASSVAARAAVPALGPAERIEVVLSSDRRREHPPELRARLVAEMMTSRTPAVRRRLVAGPPPRLARPPSLLQGGMVVIAGAIPEDAQGEGEHRGPGSPGCVGWLRRVLRRAIRPAHPRLLPGWPARTVHVVGRPEAPPKEPAIRPRPS